MYVYINTQRDIYASNGNPAIYDGKNDWQKAFMYIYTYRTQGKWQLQIDVCESVADGRQPLYTDMLGIKKKPQ